MAGGGRPEAGHPGTGEKEIQGWQGSSHGISDSLVSRSAAGQHATTAGAQRRSVHDRADRRCRGEDARDHRVELALLDLERPGHRGAAGDLDGDDDALRRRLDNPAEAAQRDEALLDVRDS